MQMPLHGFALMRAHGDLKHQLSDGVNVTPDAWWNGTCPILVFIRPIFYVGNRSSKHFSITNRVLYLQFKPNRIAGAFRKDLAHRHDRDHFALRIHASHASTSDAGVRGKVSSLFIADQSMPDTMVTRAEQRLQLAIAEFESALGRSSVMWIYQV